MRPGRAAIVLASLSFLAPTSADAQQMRCDPLESLTDLVERFQEVYPTGGLAVRLDGDGGRRVMDALDITKGPETIVFLYSGDGPITGARGRYMYLVLDGKDCIRQHDWIDGTIYDEVTRVE